MLPEWLYPGARETLAAFALGLALDAVYPWHAGLLLKLHPVHTAYLLARRLAPPYSGRLRGAAAAVAVLALHLSLYALLLYAAWLAGRLAWLVVAALVFKVSCPLAPLFDAVEKVAECLERGDLGCARGYTRWLVRRRVESLGEHHIASAAIESLAESLVDGYTSPLAYTLLLGPLGPLLQRLVNTLDSALGYKTPEYLKPGWFSARLDDVVNYIPARVTGLLAALLARVAGGCTRDAVRVWLRWRGVTESPNAGQVMAGFAGALGVWLEKPGFYVINPGASAPTCRDVRRALTLAEAVATLYTVCAALAMLATA